MLTVDQANFVKEEEEDGSDDDVVSRRFGATTPVITALLSYLRLIYKHSTWAPKPNIKSPFHFQLQLQMEPTDEIKIFLDTTSEML